MCEMAAMKITESMEECFDIGKEVRQWSSLK